MGVHVEQIKDERWRAMRGRQSETTMKDEKELWMAK